MGCLYHQCSLFQLPSSSLIEYSCNSSKQSKWSRRKHWLNCKLKHQHQQHQVLGLVGTEEGGQGYLITPLPNALPSSTVFLSLSSPASSGDYSIFLPISAALFFVYWIANFVVPDIISKRFQSEGEDQAPERVNPMEDEQPDKPNQVNLGKHSKRKGVNKSTKPS